MIIVVDLHSGVPVYRQLVDQIRFHVAGGMLKPGEEIPSTRALSAKLGVNPMTISKAFALLEEEGVLERRPGLPLVVRARGSGRAPAARADQLRRALRPVATIARQLGMGNREALDIFRTLLEEQE